MRAKTVFVPHRRQGLSTLLNPLRRAALGLLVGFAPAASAVRADDLPAPQPAHAVAGVESDGFLEKKVKAALAADPVLSRVDLVVSVMDRVAVIGGPVPDSTVTTRAESVVKGVPGLAAVKVSCWSAAPAKPDPFADRLADGLKKGNTDAGPAIPPAVATNTHLPPLAHVAPQLGPASSLATPPVVAARSPVADETASRVAAKVPIDRPAGGSGPLDGFLQDPVAVVKRPLKGGLGAKGIPAPDLAAAYPTIPSPSVPVRPVSDVKPTNDRVAEVRAADPRFAGLAVLMKDGTAIVRGRPGQAKNAWALAEALRTVPGVNRVIVRDVQ